MIDEHDNRSDDSLKTAGKAVKAGKAAADIARGVASGGIYGAAVLATGSAKKWILTTIAIVIFLPAIILAMLPTIIFGTLNGNGTEETNGFVDGQKLSDNMASINMEISTVISEGLHDVLERIDRDYAASGCDSKEVINPYGSDVVFNANQFISMYCASHSEEPEEIEVGDMVRLIKANTRKLYSMTSRDELRTSSDGSSSSGTQTIKVRIYTIRYNGEAYFADEIFGLTDEMKELSDAYSINLSLLLSDGVYQGVAGNHVIDKGISYEDVVFHEGSTPVVYFNQMDTRWINKPYGTDNIGGYACGPTSMCIVVSSLTDTEIEPPEMAAWAYEHGYWCSGNGSYHALIPAAAKVWGLNVEGCRASEPQRIADALAQGKLVVALMSKGHFTTGGHFMVLRGITNEGKVLVADPASYRRSQKTWELSLILDEASKRASAGGPFWIIGK